MARTLLAPPFGWDPVQMERVWGDCRRGPPPNHQPGDLGRVVHIAEGTAALTGMQARPIWSRITCATYLADCIHSELAVRALYIACTAQYITLRNPF